MTRGRRATRAAVALVLAVAGVTACSGGDGDGGDADDGPLVRPADEGIDGVLAIRIPPYEHTQADVDYDRSPPAGGDHGSIAAPCGFYVQPIADEHVVHALEHGAVWLAYDPDLPSEDAEVLRAAVEDHDDTLATPYAQLDPGVAVVATAWGRQLALDSVSDPRLEAFVEEYRRFETAPERHIGCQPLPEGQGG